jgi:hypothetical protein
MRLRFSIRTLLLLTIVVSLMCAWAVVPSLKTHRFVTAIQHGDHSAADQMFRTGENVLANWIDHRGIGYIGAQTLELNLSDLLLGRRRIIINTVPTQRISRLVPIPRYSSNMTVLGATAPKFIEPEP